MKSGIFFVKMSSTKRIPIATTGFAILDNIDSKYYLMRHAQEGTKNCKNFFLLGTYLSDNDVYITLVVILVCI